MRQEEEARMGSFREKYSHLTRPSEASFESRLITPLSMTIERCSSCDEPSCPVIVHVGLLLKNQQDLKQFRIFGKQLYLKKWPVLWPAIRTPPASLSDIY